MDSLHIWLTYLILGASIVGYSIERWSIEIVAITSLGALLLLFTLFPFTDASGALITPADLLAGFGNPALIAVLALLVVGQGLFATDAMSGPVRLFIGMSRLSRRASVMVILVGAGILSSVLNNTPVVVIFIPILTMLAGRKGVSPAHVFMPLSFLSILGGMTTLIGSSTNLLVAGVAARSDVVIGFFDITLPGALLAAVGGLYVLFVLPRIIQPRDSENQRSGEMSGKQFIGEITLDAKHPFLGISSVAGLFPGLRDLTPRMIIRDEQPILPPFDDVTLREGDRLIVTATRKALSDALTKGNLTIRTIGTSGMTEVGDLKNEVGPDTVMAEAVVAPGSRYVGRTMQFSGLRTQFGITLFGLQRKNRMARAALSEIRLEPGDNLLLYGKRSNIDKLRGNHDLLLLEWSAQAIPQTAKATLALAIFLMVVGASALGVLPIAVAAIAGALAMIATGCLTTGEAARAVDRQILLLIGAAIAAAVALERTGGAALIAETAVSLLKGTHPAFLLSGLFLVIAVLTNLLSNNATAVLFTPIALDIAARIGAPPEAFLACVIFGANMSFATPIGYQTNLLVMGPGRYRFSDFVMAGAPLVALMWLTFSLLGPLIYDL